MTIIGQGSEPNFIIYSFWGLDFCSRALTGCLLGQENTFSWYSYYYLYQKSFGCLWGDRMAFETARGDTAQ